MIKYVKIFFVYCLLILPFVFWELNFCHGNLCGMFSMFMFLPIGIFLLILLLIIAIVEKVIKNTNETKSDSDINKNIGNEKNSKQTTYNIFLFLTSIIMPFVVLESMGKKVSFMPFDSNTPDGVTILILVISVIANCLKNQKIKEMILIPMIIIECAIIIIYKTSFY